MSRCGCDLGGREWRRFLGAWFCQRFSQENSSSTFVWCLSRMEVQQQNLFYLWRLQRRDVDRRESKILGSPFLVIPQICFKKKVTCHYLHRGYQQFYQGSLIRSRRIYKRSFANEGIVNLRRLEMTNFTRISFHPAHQNYASYPWLETCGVVMEVFLSITGAMWCGFIGLLDLEFQAGFGPVVRA